MNQTAQNLASYGRNGDTTLVHMSPQEVSGLQALARNNGTTMTINPHTGLPEAFSLGRLLPMIAGFALGPAGLGMSAMQAGLAAGALGTAATGSLREGIGIGLGAAGGAGLAGSMSNLAAGPSSTLPANSLAGSPGVMGGAGSGITIPTNAINTAAPGQLVNYDALSKAGGIGLKAPALPPLEVTAGTNFGLTTATAPVTNYSLTSGTQLPSLGASNAANSQFSLNSVTSNAPQGLRLNAMGAPTSSMTAVPPEGALAKDLTGLDALKQAEVSRNFGQTGLRTLPSSVNAQGFATSSEPIVSDLGSGYSGTLTPPQDIVSLKGPTMTDRFNRVVAGGEKAFGSMDAAGEFLGNNKMNLAMASAPMFLEEPEPLPEEESYIRPYSLDVENTSDRPASALGREEERLRYKYTAGTPYRAAQGGIIAFAQGGNMPDGQEMNTNPAMMRRMDEMQIPPFAGIMDPNRMKEIYGMGSSGGQGYAEGGETGRREVRKKINRMDDPYAFAAYQSGRGLYDAALQNFAAGGLSNVPRFLSGGGDGMSDSIPASINDRQPARLADGEFVIPADVVSHLGNGSSKAGAKQLYAMMDRIRTKRTGKKKQAPAVNPRKTMPA
jgi:hypothetical protein